MSERRLTVSALEVDYRPRSYNRSWYMPPKVPYIRMRGKWLRRLGFRIGSRIRVQAEPGRLVLTAAPVGEVCEPEPGE